MRFIIHELPYETPLAAGQWRYEQDGAPTGAVESWRLTAAQDGWTIWRVDLDAREAASGRSTLYHLLLDADGRPAQLRYRLWRGAAETTGTAVFEPDDLILVTEQGGARDEQVLPLPPAFVFWFPAATALGRLVDLANRPAGDAVLLELDEDGAALVPRQTTLEADGAGTEERPLALRWDDQERRLWLDESGWPRRVARQDGLTAVQARLTRYEQ